MKKWILLVLALTWSQLLLADLGNCLLYRLQFTLNDGAVLTAILPVSGYEDYCYLTDSLRSNAYCSDTGAQKMFGLLRERHRVYYEFLPAEQDRIAVFRKIYLPRHYVYQDRQGAAITPSDRVFLEFDSVRGIKFISVEQCPYDWIQIEFLVTTPGRIDTLDRIEPVNRYELFGENEAFVFLNYNPANNQQELDRLGKLYYRDLFPLPFRDREENADPKLLVKRVDRIRRAKQKLARRGIFVFHWQGTC